MKKELYKEISIPDGIGVSLDGDILKIEGGQGETERKFKLYKIELKKEVNKIIIGGKKLTKKEKKIMNTYVSHIKNMIKGVQEKFEYKLKVCFAHFPINVKTEDNKLIIKNFLGEKKERVANLPKGIEIEVKKDIITVRSVNKELAGQAASEIERSTRIKKRDKRIFQDGIWIISRAGKRI